MGLKVTGIKSTTARLDNILERSNRKAYDILKKASEDAKKRIELQMHRDTGAMERALRVRKLLGSGLNGRTSYEIYISPEARRRRPKRGGGVTRQRVTTYTKHLESGDYKGLGKGSVAKQALVSGLDQSLKVGPGFFARSVNFIEAVYGEKLRRALEEENRKRRP